MCRHVTGLGTSGIGLEIVKKLAGTTGHTTILTSRDRERGLKASDALKRDGLETVYKQLDINNPSSVEVSSRPFLSQSRITSWQADAKIDTKIFGGLSCSPVGGGNCWSPKLCNDVTALPSPHRANLGFKPS